MKLITKQDALKWCNERGIAIREDSPHSSRLRFDCGMRAVRVGVDGSAVNIFNLAYVLLMTGVPDDDEDRFEGALVWLRDWDIWSEGIEHVGHLLLAGIRGSGLGSPSVLEAPAHVFGPDEFVAAKATLVLPMLFQWDALLAPVHGRFVACLSHHGHFDLFVPDIESELELVARFNVGGHDVQLLGEVDEEQ